MRGLAALAQAASARSLEDPQLPLTSTALAEWLSPRTLAGVPVSEDRAFGLTAWYRGVALLAGTMAALPIKVYRKGGRERVRVATVLDNPNPAQTPFEFWQTMFCNAPGWGTAYARKLRDRAGIVRQIWPIHPSRVRFEPASPTDANPEGRLFHVRDGITGVEKTYTARDIFMLPYLSPHGNVGIPPLRFARQVLGITVAAEETAARFYGSGARLSGILSSKKTLTDEGANKLKQRFREKAAGPDNAGDVLVLDQDTSFAPLAVPPQDAQLLESRKFGVDEIARLLGLPPHLLGSVEKSTSWGTGIEQQVIGLVKFNLSHWAALAEQRITRELLPGGWSAGTWFAEYALEGLLRGDAQARAEFLAKLIQWGVITRNEARGLENWEPLDGLDEPLTPSNMTVISIDGTPMALGGAGDGGGDGNGNADA